MSEDLSAQITRLAQEAQAELSQRAWLVTVTGRGVPGLTGSVLILGLYESREGAEARAVAWLALKHIQVSIDWSHEMRNGLGHTLSQTINNALLDHNPLRFSLDELDIHPDAPGGTNA